METSQMREPKPPLPSRYVRDFELVLTSSRVLRSRLAVVDVNSEREGTNDDLQ